MPINGPSSFPQTTEQFLAHWGLANAALPSNSPLILPGQGNPPGAPVPLDGLETLYNALMAKRAELQGKQNSQEIARGSINQQKELLLLRANQFNEAVRALHPGSKYERALPDVPAILMSQAPFTEPLDDANDVWVQINADPAVADILLLDGYTQAMFLVDLTALKASYKSFNTAEVSATFSREERNDLQDLIYPVLRSYRQVLPTKFAKTHALIESLPRLTPESGSTPDAVTANGSWIVASLMAKLLWTASSDANLSYYEIRFCAGPNYTTDNESVIGTVLPGGTLEFLTDSGLTNPGSTASFKVYVVTSTGNEKGSNTVTITRPAA